MHKQYRRVESSRTRINRHAPIEALEHRTLLSASSQLLAAPAAAAAKPVVTIIAPRSKAYEGKRTGYLQVARTGGNLAAPLSVSLAIGGRAKSDIDYKAIPSTIVIPAGKTSASIAVAPIDDTILERAEDVTVAIAANAGYDIGATGRSSVWIFDNDGAVVTIAATIPTTTEGAAGPGVFKFTRTTLLDQPVKVSYSIKGTAQFGVDYSKFNNYLIIPARKASVTLKINAIDDITPEIDETVILTLANGWFQAGRTWRATATIKDNDARDPGNQGSFPAGTQFIVFRGPSTPSTPSTSTQPGHVYRGLNQGGALPTDISKALNDIGTAGVDTAINTSPNAKWMVLHTDRFGGTPGTSSLGRLRGDDITSGEQIRVNGNLIAAADGPSAISSDGNTIVYASSTDGLHAIDLWAAQFASGQWTTQILTGSVGWNYDYNIQPAISADGAKVLFAAGNAAGDAGTEIIAEVGVTGTGLTTVVTRANAPVGSKADAYLNHPAFAASGAIVFGSNFNTTDQLWKLNAAAPTAALVSTATGEISPAVFADGSIISLWRNHTGNSSNVLELTLRYADGSYRGTIAPGIDLPNMGLGVGTWPVETPIL